MQRVDARVRFLSAEPLLGNVTIWRGVWVPDWAIIGAQTGPGAPPVSTEYADELTYYADLYGVPIFHKDNLGDVFTSRAWPIEMAEGPADQ
jgi:protein gp37